MKPLLFALLTAAAVAQPPPLPLPPPPPQTNQVYWNLTMAWDTPDSPSIRYYRIYQGVSPIATTQYVQVGVTNRAVISVPVRGVTNYLSASSLDDLGRESDHTPEITFIASDWKPKTNQVVSVHLQYDVGPTLSGPWVHTNILLMSVTNPASNLFIKGGRLVVTNAVY